MIIQSHRASSTRVLSVTTVAILAALGMLTGCGNSRIVEGPVDGVELKGVLQGGQQPVANATIQLYAAGTTGDRSAATALLTSAVTSDASGNFDITSKFTCPSQGTLVYLVATGGNPGLASGTNNAAISMMAALGACGSLNSNTYIFVNEITTVGSIAALYPFMSSYTGIGSSTTDAAQLAAAFAAVNEYTDIATGAAPGPTLPANFYASSVEIDTLADAVSTCINSTGGVAGDGSACGNLFLLAKQGTVAAPVDVADALVSIINFPDSNVAAIFGLVPSSGAPFNPVLSSAPPNWQLPIVAVPATPTFLPGGGTYTGEQSVTISESTAGASIYYTTNGTAPTTSSTLYSGPITVSASATIKAIANEGARASSGIGSAAYLIQPAAAASTPTFSPAAGMYPSAQTVTISSSTAGASIYYTTDGSTPTTSSSSYTGPITVYTSETVQAIAIAQGTSISAVGSAAYVMPSSYGYISTVAGDGANIYNGDGILATSASLDFPYNIAIDASGDLFIADYGHQRVRKVTPAGIISTVAGNGTAGPPFNGGPATQAYLNGPDAVTLDSNGNLYIADDLNYEVRKVTPAGIITAYAGNELDMDAGDGGLATGASTENVCGLAMDNANNLYIADCHGNRVRLVTPAGIISTIAGTGVAGFSGDGGAATSAELSEPIGLALDQSGNLYISEAGNNRIRKVNTAGIITTYAGTGTAGFSGDGGTAIDAELNQPEGLGIDAAGNLYIADSTNQRIRMVTLAGVISSVAGTGIEGFSGDGGPAVVAQLGYPSGVQVDGQGSLYIADRQNERVRKVTFSTVAPQVVVPGFSLLAGTYNGTQSLVLDDPTNGASIYYTTDGSMPSVSSTLYTGQITIAASQTVNAIGVSTGYATSAVGSNAYVVTNLPTAAIPTFSPAPGTFTSSQSVVLSTSIAGAAIHYTTDGSSPTSASTLYTGAIPISSSATIKTIAVAGGYANSPIASGGYFINQGTGIITTFAGNGVPGSSGDGGPATAAEVAYPENAVFDGSGNVYFSSDGVAIRKVNPSGIITTIAGSTTYGFSGDGGPATGAKLFGGNFIAIDALGNLYIADQNNCRIRKVNTAGIITTVAGNGTYGYSGDNGPATAAALSEPEGIAVDGAGNLYIADEDNYRIRKVTPAGIITTVAGTGSSGYSGDGQLAVNAQLDQPSGVAVDSAGNLYIADLFNRRIRMVNTAGIISTVAGNGNTGYTGDGGRATAAELDEPVYVSVDNAGNFYIADSSNNRIRMVNSAGIISTVAGSGADGYNGDGEAATNASMDDPEAVSIDSTGNLYIADYYNQRVRKVSYGDAFQAAAPTFSLPAGNYTTVQTLYLLSATPAAAFYYTTDGSIPTSMSTPYTGSITISNSETVTAIAVAPGYTNSPPASAVYTTNILPIVATPTFSPAPGSYNASVQVTLGTSAGAAIYYTLDGSTPTAGSTLYTGAIPISSSSTINAIGVENGYTTSSVGVGAYLLNQGIGIMTTYAGTGAYGSTGDGGPATSATLSGLEATILDAAGNLYFSEHSTAQVRKITPAGIITTVAGNGSLGFSGDGGAATSAEFYYPNALAIDTGGNLYIADTYNCRIREVTAAGIISTIAGNGTCAYTGDGAYAVNAEINQPASLAVDRAGNIYFGDAQTARVRRINAQGIVTTIAGNGTSGFSGDGGPATSAAIGSPAALALDSSANLYIGDAGNSRVRMVTPAGIISTVAGSSLFGFSGDGGPATSAALSQPVGLAVDGAGNLYISDEDNNRIRKVTAAGIISTIGGTASSGFNGDGLAATLSNLSSPDGVAVDAVGNVYIADAGDQRIRKIFYSNAFQAAPPTFSVLSGSYTTVQTLYLTSTTPAASFYYTTDGSNPSTSTSTSTSATATLYGGSITISTSETITAVTVVPGYANSALVGMTYTTNIPPVAATPTFSPAPGSYTSSQSVTIADSAGVAIYYTTDGSAPSTASTPYAGPISVAGSQTLNAIGVLSGYSNSPIASAGYLINQGIGIITTVAGNGTSGHAGDGNAATSAEIDGPGKVAVDTAGNFYIADVYNNRIRKVSAAGVITTFAGTGTSGFSGDGGPATSANLSFPVGVAVDHAGNIYIADTQNNRIRKVSAAGVITTVAGTGTAGYNGDGITAISAEINLPNDVTVDNLGNLYIADTTNNRVRKIIPSGYISSVTGNGIAGFTGDGSVAYGAEVNAPSGVAVDSLGNLYIADTGNSRIRKVTASGILSTVAGSTATGFSGDNGPATSAGLNNPQGVAVDSAGNFYIADGNDYRIREVNSSGVISTIAGTGANGFGGDGGAATAATYGYISGVAVDSTGNVYLSDTSSARIRKIFYGDSLQTAAAAFSIPAGSYTTAQSLYLASTTPNAVLYYTTDGSLPGTGSTRYSGPIALTASETISVIAVTPGYSNSAIATAAYSITILPFASTPVFSPAPGSYSGAQQVTLTSTAGAAIYYTTDGSLPTTASTLYSGAISIPASATINALAILNGYNNSALAVGGFFINQGAGIISTFAGGGTGSTIGDGGPATAAKLGQPNGTVFDRAGDLFIADESTQLVRKITAAGIISTVAGTIDTFGFTGDGGPATSADLLDPRAVAVDGAGNLYIADSANYRVRKVTPAGIISTIAGTGTYASTGDGGLATGAALDYPTGIAIDAGGNIYIAEQVGNRIRKINAAGYISTYAGTGIAGFSGDGNAATSAQLSGPSGMTLDAAGDLFFAEFGNQRIRKVSPAGIITTVAGNGSQGYNGDGTTATSASLYNPTAVAVDNAGNLYITDATNQRVRKVNAAGIISTIAGTGKGGFSGDGAVATGALINTPAGVVIDNVGNVYISDENNSRIRKITY